MGFNVGNAIKHGASSVSHAFKDTGTSIKHTVQDVGHTVGKSVGTVYKDVKSATAYTGKHLIKDVDNVANILSNPLLYIVGGIVIVVVLTRM